MESHKTGATSMLDADDKGGIDMRRGPGAGLGCLAPAAPISFCDSPAA